MKTKTMTGTVYGFANVNETWAAGGTMKLNDEDLKLNFSYQGTYSVLGKCDKPNYYTGMIYRNQKLAGKAYLWVFENNRFPQKIIEGQWVEDGNSFQLFGKFVENKLGKINAWHEETMEKESKLSIWEIEGKRLAAKHLGKKAKSAFKKK